MIEKYLHDYTYLSIHQESYLGYVGYPVIIDHNQKLHTHKHKHIKHTKKTPPQKKTMIIPWWGGFDVGRKTINLIDWFKTD